jgi:hypothetical protein
MSDFTIEVYNTNHILDIETSIIDIINNIEIETSSNESLEIVTDYSAGIVYASDIIGLDNYLSNFIDSYNIDCGTP